METKERLRILNEEKGYKRFRLSPQGFINVYSKDGHKRKNWMKYYRTRSRKYLKKHCDICGSRKKLTIHHIKPLLRYLDNSKENCQTLCNDCHVWIHRFD